MQSAQNGRFTPADNARISFQLDEEPEGSAGVRGRSLYYKGLNLGEFHLCSLGGVISPD